jgi:hypothetical protein
MRIRTLLMIAIAALSAAAHADTTQDMNSPNGRIHLRFGIAKHWFERGGKPYYQIDLDGKTLIDHSALGMEFQTGGALSGLELKKTDHRSADSNYTMTTGKDHDIRDHSRKPKAFTARSH